MSKRKLLVGAGTLALTLLAASPAFAQGDVFGDDNAVANIGGFVSIDSTFTQTTETTETTTELIFLSPLPGV